MPPDVGDPWGSLGPLVLLLAANAFFVLAEYAFVRVRETQLMEIAERSARARLALRIVRNLDTYISADQVGVTMANLLIGFLGEPALARLIEPAFGWLVSSSMELFHAITFLVTFAVVTYLTLVASELAPKQIAIQAALPLALWCAYPLEAFRRVMFPFVALAGGSAALLVRALGFKPGLPADFHSEDELRLLVAASTRSGVLQESERAILANALGFADRVLRQVMVPRTEIAAVPEDADRQAIRAIARRRPYSRLPVYRETLDDIIGVLHLRDLALRPDALALARDLMRPVPMLPEVTHVDRALAELRRQRASLAIVIDEFGGTAGLVTVEDIVEELVGDVQDEFEAPHAERIVEAGPGTYVIDGLVTLDELNERLRLDPPEDAAGLYDTVGGMVFGELGRVPVLGDRVRWGQWDVEVTGLDGRRVAMVRATTSPEDSRPETGDL